MTDAFFDVTAGGLMVFMVFAVAFIIGKALKLLGLETPEVESRSAGSVTYLPGSREPRTSIGSREVLRGSGADRDPTHKLRTLTEFDACDWSASCSCGAIQHGLSSKAACMSWQVVHASVAEKMKGLS